MHSHKDALLFLDTHLKYGYVKEAIKRLAALGHVHTAGDIRNIKNGITINWKVLEVLAEIALENKTAKEKVEELINNN